MKKMSNAKNFWYTLKYILSIPIRLVKTLFTTVFMVLHLLTILFRHLIWFVFFGYIAVMLFRPIYLNVSAGVSFFKALTLWPRSIPYTFTECFSPNDGMFIVTLIILVILVASIIWGKLSDDEKGLQAYTHTLHLYAKDMKEIWLNFDKDIFKRYEFEKL